ncbi:MAG: tol-pal system protein YbgF [Methylococcales bacterium]|nr:tol-pal system protein YbgF [Methylococcales bacterium]
MKKYAFLLLCLCGSAVAESELFPPVIDNSSYPASTPLPNAAAPSSKALYDVIGRLDQLQIEVQQLRGKVEEQGNLIVELKKNQTTLYSDFDERLQNAEKGGSPSPAVQPVAETPAAHQTTVTDLSAPPAVPAPTPGEPEVTAPAPASKPPAPAVQASGGEKQAYQQAYSSLRSGKTDQSIEQFKAYLSQYPTGGYADIAHYYLGEAYRVKPDADSARQAYNLVLEKYPNSTKIADTLLRLGTIEADQKNNEKAREYLTRVTTEFANTPAAHSAEKKLQQLK